MKHIYSTVRSISSIRSVDADIEELEVTMDDLSTYTMFYNYNESIQFVDKEVEFDVRKDVVNGIIKEVINTIAEKRYIQCVELDESLEDAEIESMPIIAKESSFSPIITFNSTTTKKGDFLQNQIVLVCASKSGRSFKASWQDFTCIDCNSKSFNLRVFSNIDGIDEISRSFVGNYVMADIEHTSYGFQVNGDIRLYEMEVEVPKEVNLCLFKLGFVVRRDKELKSYVDKYEMLTKLKNIIYYEPGYHLVEMEAEIMLIHTICSIYDIYDKKLLIRAVFASRGYLFGSNTELSNPIINYHRIITSDLRNDLDLIKLLDITYGVNEGDVNKGAYLAVRNMVTAIMKERRGIYEKNIINDCISTINNKYNGLLQRGLIDMDNI